MDPKGSSDMSTVDMTTKAPSYAGSKRSASSSSTLVDVSPNVGKSKIPDSRIPESATPVEDEDESEEEWMDGNDYPQFVNHDETWKTITVGDMKRCKLPSSLFFVQNANGKVVEGGRQFMPRLIPVSPPRTEESQQGLQEAVKVLNDAVAQGYGQLRIVRAETLFTECSCMKE